jgi:hypothetical protein
MKEFIDHEGRSLFIPEEEIVETSQGKNYRRVWCADGHTFLVSKEDVNDSQVQTD